MNSGQVPIFESLIEVTAHDVLCGKGVSIANHPGNERFRALVQSHKDSDYCSGYSAEMKKTIATDIIQHIQSLDPPGRFLKRQSNANGAKRSRGLKGPWEVLTNIETIKKTCQALRDCNRSDRSNYAIDVPVPEDVKLRVASRPSLVARAIQQRSRPRFNPGILASPSANDQCALVDSTCSLLDATPTTVTTAASTGSSDLFSPPRPRVSSVEDDTHLLSFMSHREGITQMESLVDIDLDGGDSLEPLPIPPAEVSLQNDNENFGPLF